MRNVDIKCLHGLAQKILFSSSRAQQFVQSVSSSLHSISKNLRGLLEVIRAHHFQYFHFFYIHHFFKNSVTKSGFSNKLSKSSISRRMVRKFFWTFFFSWLTIISWTYLCKKNFGIAIFDEKSPRQKEGFPEHRRGVDYSKRRKLTTKSFYTAS